MAGSTVVASLEWKHGLRFKASAEGRELVLDGERRAGFSPTEALSLALAGCMAIDVVVILKKRRGTIDALRVRIEGTRAETEPRRFTRLRLGFELAGSGFTAAHVERALELSREKYCSVWHSLRQDIELETTFLSEVAG